jgi:hypothetical protein
VAVRAELVHPAQQGQLEAQEERGRLGLQVSQERQDLVVVPGGQEALEERGAKAQQERQVQVGVRAALAGLAVQVEPGPRGRPVQLAGQGAQDRLAP